VVDPFNLLFQAYIQRRGYIQTPIFEDIAVKMTVRSIDQKSTVVFAVLHLVTDARFRAEMILRASNSEN
jgi:hypothetical protein